MKYAIIALAALLGACSNPQDARRVLEDAGYTNVQTSGYRAFRCSEDDSIATGFIATGPTGRTVAGTVCKKGLWGSSTIRLD